VLRIITVGDIDDEGFVETLNENIKIKREEQGRFEAAKAKKSEFSLIEKKMADLSMLQEIIKTYTNNNQAVLIMGEAMTRILENNKKRYGKAIFDNLISVT
jgi:hypothetical protein